MTPLWLDNDEIAVWMAQKNRDEKKRGEGMRRRTEKLQFSSAKTMVIADTQEAEDHGPRNRKRGKTSA